MNDNSTLKIKNEINHERDFRVWWRCVFGVIGGILIAVGFAFAAQQHFNALQCSAQNVQMQKERERLKKEQKQLLFEREMAASPAQLESRARKIGLQNVDARQINRLDENGVAFADVNRDEEGEQQMSQRLETASVENQKSKVN